MDNHEPVIEQAAWRPRIWILHSVINYICVSVGVSSDFKAAYYIEVTKKNDIWRAKLTCQVEVANDLFEAARGLAAHKNSILIYQSALAAIDKGRNPVDALTALVDEYSALE